VETVKVFQIGLGSFGRHGFEKFVEMDRHYEEVDVQLMGVCDSDFDRLDMAEKFADSQDIEMKTFTSTEKAYQEAEKENSDDCKIMIYDAGPTELHAEHIFRSLKNGFFHLAEKPPSMTREDHIKEKKLMLDNDVRFTVDFIERESPVVKKALELTEDKDIESIEVFRESSIGIQKILQPVERMGVKGGAVLDKMSHEAYIMDFLKVGEVESVDKNFYMPFDVGSDSFMNIRSGKTSQIDEMTATGMCTARISGEADIILHSSWLGSSERSRTLGEELEELTGLNPVDSDFSILGDEGFLNEESRFFVLKGERSLFGDMLHKRLFDLESGEEIELESMLHDQLYRVLESSIRCAADLENNTLSEEEIDQYMNLIFDISEHVEDIDEFEALEASNSRVQERILDNVFEAEGLKEEV
jgi:predicted dehydrogenase